MRFGLIFLTIAIGIAWTPSSDARPPYAEKMYAQYEEFGKKHGDEAKKKVSCSVCHIKNGARTETKKRNNYGVAIMKGLKKKNDTENIVEALKKAADMSSKTKDKTFGDLIKALELPGTNEENK